MTERSSGTRERELFEELVEYPLDIRVVRLRERCGDDAELRRRLERLLLAHDRADALTGGFRGAAVPSAGLKLGTTVGPYRLLEKLGEGGMGTVFLAEQGEPIRREVALKVVRVGMDSDKVIARFEAERQTLARMEHPGIARVYDAGSTADGRPFFAMELARGPSITAHADRERLTARQRLELFVELCGAVEHAHQRGVIHRDLKPSNVLVPEGSRPIPKVIDFGIAKATEEEPDGPLLTIESQVLGTPAYMSPEQARGAVGEVDTRSDVYSLGVLLYELLTGTPPILLEPSEGVVAVLKQVMEVDPERPSTRAGTTTEASRAAAEARRTRPEALQRFLRGDLDRIVLKAMEKERDRRYESARALAEDVRRFLAYEPIEARAPTLIYLTRRFVRRHRGLAAGLLLASVGIVAGTVAAVVWALRAERSARLATAAELVAQSEARTSDEALVFVERLFAAAAPTVPDGEELTVRQVVDTALAGLTERFTDRSRAGARVQAMLGSVLVALGDYPEADRQLTRALPVLDSADGGDHHRVLSARISHADALRRLERIDEARAHYLEVLNAVEGDERDPELVVLPANAEVGLGFLDREAERYASAEEHFRAAIRWLERARNETPSSKPRPGSHWLPA